MPSAGRGPLGPSSAAPSAPAAAAATSLLQPAGKVSFGSGPRSSGPASFRPRPTLAASASTSVAPPPSQSALLTSFHSGGEGAYYDDDEDDSPLIGAAGAAAVAAAAGGASSSAPRAAVGRIVHLGDDYGFVLSAPQSSALDAYSGSSGGREERHKFKPRDVYIAADDDAPASPGGVGPPGAGVRVVRSMNRDVLDGERWAAFRSLHVDDMVTFMLRQVGGGGGGTGKKSAADAVGAAPTGKTAVEWRVSRLMPVSDSNASSVLMGRLAGGQQQQQQQHLQIGTTASASNSSAFAPGSSGTATATPTETAAALRFLGGVAADAERAISGVTTLIAMCSDPRLYSHPEIACALLRVLANGEVAAHPRAGRLYTGIRGSPFITDARGLRACVLRFGASAGGADDSSGNSGRGGSRGGGRGGRGGKGDSSNSSSGSGRVADARARANAVVHDAALLLSTIITRVPGSTAELGPAVETLDVSTAVAGGGGSAKAGSSAHNGGLNDATLDAVAGCHALYHDRRGAAMMLQLSGGGDAPSDASLLAPSSTASASAAASDEGGEGADDADGTVNSSSSSGGGKARDFRYMSVFPTAAELQQGSYPLASDTSNNGGSGGGRMHGEMIRLDPSVRANLTSGRYPSAAHYLDTQFRLLREDCMAPLRSGIAAYRAHRQAHVLSLTGPSATGVAESFRRSHNEVCVYYDVCVLGIRCVRSGVCYTLSFSQLGNKGVAWERSKRLLYGSLVVLSASDFSGGGGALHNQFGAAIGSASAGSSSSSSSSSDSDDLLWAVVSDRDPANMGGSGPRRIDVSFPSGFEPRLRSGVSYTMVEASASDFEAYAHVLRALQSMDVDEFEGNDVFSTILNVPSSLPPPRYLTASTSSSSSSFGAAVGASEPSSSSSSLLRPPDEFNMSHIFPPGGLRRNSSGGKGPTASSSSSIGTECVFSVLDEPWPLNESDTSLDANQLAAVKLALTSSLALIQGPPGTGKTFVGLRVMHTLLKNVHGRSVHRPILVVCYTNHALDQFLEGIASFEESVVRIGSRSRSEALARFNLKAVMQANREADKRAGVGGERARLRRSLLARQKELESQLADAAAAGEGCVLLESALSTVAPRYQVRAIFRGVTVPSSADDDELDDNDESDLAAAAAAAASASTSDSADGGAAALSAAAAERWRRWLGVDPTVVAECGDGATRKEAIVDPTLIQQQQGQSVGSSGPSLSGKGKGGASSGGGKRGKLQQQQLLSGGATAAIDAATPSTSAASDLARDEEEDGSDEEDADRLKEVSAEQELADIVEEDEALAAAAAAAATRGRGNASGGGYNAPPSIVIKLPLTPVTEPPMRRTAAAAGGGGGSSGGRGSGGGGWRGGYAEIMSSSPAPAASEGGGSRGGRRNFTSFADFLAASSSGAPPSPSPAAAAVAVRANDATPSASSPSAAASEAAQDAQLAGSRDLWGLSYYHRARLYRHWLRRWNREVSESCAAIAVRYQAVSRELSAMVHDEELDILAGTRVVGMTTTAVAKHRRLLAALKPEIVVVEEAAEVLEAHIVAALTSGVSHLILIGDHQQLRPSTAVYHLATQYGLDVSLFERLIRNGVPHVTLGNQRRMRPDVSRLVGHLYPHGLADHASVSEYPPVRGVSASVFFLDHCEPEGGDGGGGPGGASKTNVHEAGIIAGLARYLLAQGYAPGDITVLTPYVGQLHILRQLFRGGGRGGSGSNGRLDASSGNAVGALADVKLTTVDNFQGEESTIILLSLVRSNEVGSIGFLGIPNRVCVALSRAKHGMYIVGNAGLLWDTSELWRKILGLLQERSSVGTSLDLVCSHHPETRTAITTPADFARVPHGGCARACKESLTCGHPCGRSCHPYPHSAIQCARPCERVFPDCGHPCGKTCRDECGSCMREVVRVLPSCGHSKRMACSIRAENVECDLPCERTLACGHACANICSAHCTLYCTVPVEKAMPGCGHVVPLPCSKEPTDAVCEVMVDTPAVYTGPLLTMRCDAAARLVRSIMAR